MTLCSTESRLLNCTQSFYKLCSGAYKYTTSCRTGGSTASCTGGVTCSVSAKNQCKANCASLGCNKGECK